ncbi:hypothetical protein MAR_010505 [Mya arenaria]|uniref:ATP synthase F0 subunit 8 n=1 Tax=Mya arenaria TaxID=6604 RepID=A0ABY7E4P8_MYAAR|nr:hypothetical protein MAR_010505 [Mya arenaria]
MTVSLNYDGFVASNNDVFITSAATIYTVILFLFSFYISCKPSLPIVYLIYVIFLQNVFFN